MFEKNLQYIGNNPDSWFSENVNESTIEYLGVENQTHYFYSKKYNKQFTFNKEIPNNHDVSKFKKQLILVFGIGSIDEIAHIIKNKNKSSKIFIIEPNPIFLSYVLEYENLEVLNRSDVFIFCDPDKKNLLSFFSTFLSYFDMLSLIKCVAVCFNEYYRQYDIDIVKEFLNEVRMIFSSKVKILGNAVQDGILGLEHNFKNMLNLEKSKDVREIKGAYKDKPAIIVAAGPSLNKNIHYLKDVKGKALIIAVDTIAIRLVNEGIIPDFVCSIERGIETYDYFYKDKQYPQETTLVGPLVLYPKIYEEYKGNYIIPFREGVSEYHWLEDMTGLGNNYISLGLSCAHVAFGTAMHLECSPIILVGQDLAFANDGKETHAKGTIYDNKEDSFLAASAARTLNENEWIDGYNGGKVRTSKIWIQFKNIYEQLIIDNNLSVINATEGGADIAHTEKLSLKLAIENYCKNDIEDFYSYIQSVQYYNFSMKNLKNNLKDELGRIKELKDTALNLIYKLKNLDINDLFFKNKLNKIANVFEKAEQFRLKIHGHKLLIHNLQGQILIAEWRINELGLDFNREKVKQIADIRMRLLWTIVAAITEVEDLINEFLNEHSKTDTDGKDFENVNK